MGRSFHGRGDTNNRALNRISEIAEEIDGINTHQGDFLLWMLCLFFTFKSLIHLEFSFGCGVS